MVVLVVRFCRVAFSVHLDGFFIRQSVSVGFRLLPSREQLDVQIFQGRREEVLPQYRSFIDILQRIYEIIDGVYTAKNYLQLP